MLNVDLHIHTTNSLCAHHTPLEVMRLCRDKGIGLIALTDHGPACNGTVRHTFFDVRRFPRAFEGMVVLKGMETNILDLKGTIDLPGKLGDKVDVILAGLHPTPFPSSDLERNTQAVVAAIEGPMPVDIISHPDQHMYPIDPERLVQAAAEQGTAIELNNSGVVLGKADPNRTRRLVDLGAKVGCLFALNSDSHTWIELGEDQAMRRFLREMDAPPLNIINDWPIDKVMEHFEGRRQARAKAMQHSQVMASGRVGNRS